VEGDFGTDGTTWVVAIASVRLKSVCENLLLNGEGDNGGANSSLLYYQKNKTTKLAWQII
jgi:hypothetical protein